MDPRIFYSFRTKLIDTDSIINAVLQPFVNYKPANYDKNYQITPERLKELETNNHVPNDKELAYLKFDIAKQFKNQVEKLRNQKPPLDKNELHNIISKLAEKHSKELKKYKTHNKSSSLSHADGTLEKYLQKIPEIIEQSKHDIKQNQVGINNALHTALSAQKKGQPAAAIAWFKRVIELGAELSEEDNDKLTTALSFGVLQECLSKDDILKALTSLKKDDPQTLALIKECFFDPYKDTTHFENLLANRLAKVLWEPSILEPKCSINAGKLKELADYTSDHLPGGKEFIDKLLQKPLLPSRKNEARIVSTEPTPRAPRPRRGSSSDNEGL